MICRKRKRSRSDSSDSNLQKSVKTRKYGKIIKFNTNLIDWSEWVAATLTKNYILQDGLLDVLKTKASTLTKINIDYEDQFIQTIGNYDSNFVNAIMNQGIKFEKNVMKLIEEKLGKNKIINIGGDSNPRSHKKYKNTIKAMKKGIPVIYQGILRNYKNKTYGISDILIRTDYITKIIEKTSIANSKIRAPLLNKRKKYHYIVIDIKFKTLHLKSDGIHLRNDGHMKAYKSQLCIYNEALGQMQGYEPSAAFILGWKWKYVSKNVNFKGDSCFDRLGKIDYQKSDKHYKNLTQEAVNWILNVRKNAHSWDLSKLPLPHEQLYPNMCNRLDYPYHNIKKKFAEDINEISLIWKCGPKQRKIAHENGVYSWKDKSCIPENLGINGKSTKKIVSRILEANHSDTEKIIPRYISNNFEDWKNPKPIEFFVDFETTCSVFTDFDDMYSDSIIFMIGVGYIEPESERWIFRHFTVNQLDPHNEYRICKEFHAYIRSILFQYDLDNAAIYHWSSAEPSSWTRMIKRHIHFTANWRDLYWVDLIKLFHAEPIGIRGCLNYGLKNIAKTFYSHGFIKTTWDTDSKCLDGADAALGAYKVNKQIKKSGGSFINNPLIKDIGKYNEVDCKVLFEILTYLRDNHVDPEDIDIINPDIGIEYFSDSESDTILLDEIQSFNSNDPDIEYFSDSESDTVLLENQNNIYEGDSDSDYVCDNDSDYVCDNDSDIF